MNGLRRTRIPACLVVCIMARSLDADPPQINHMQPGAAIPGQTLNVTVFGQRLDQPTMLWTSFPAKVELAAGELRHCDIEPKGPNVPGENI